LAQASAAAVTTTNAQAKVPRTVVAYGLLCILNPALYWEYKLVNKLASFGNMQVATPLKKFIGESTLVRRDRTIGDLDLPAKMDVTFWCQQYELEHLWYQKVRQWNGWLSSPEWDASTSKPSRIVLKMGALTAAKMGPQATLNWLERCRETGSVPGVQELIDQLNNFIEVSSKHSKTFFLSLFDRTSLLRSSKFISRSEAGRPMTSGSLAATMARGARAPVTATTVTDEARGQQQDDHHAGSKDHHCQHQESPRQGSPQSQSPRRQEE
jgi:hypothetical protein